MKKRKKTLILLIVLLLLAVGAYLAVTMLGGGKKDEEETEQEIYTIVERNRLEVDSITYTFDGQTITLNQVADEQWEYEDDTTFPVYDYRATLMSGCMTRIVSEVKLDDNNPEYGLDDPVIVVNAKYDDGTELAMAIGAYNSYSDLYYARFSNTDGVYLIETKYYRYFAYTLNQLATPEDMPSVRSSTIESVDITGGPDGDFSMRLAQEGELYSDDYKFVTQASNGAVVGVDPDTSKQMVNEIGDMETYACHNYDATDEEKAEVGVNGGHVITVKYSADGVPQTLKLDVGNVDDEGYRYAVINDSRMIVLITDVTLGWMVNTSDNSARTKEICALTQRDVTAMKVTYGGRTYDFGVNWKSATSGDFTLDGQEIGTNKFKTFFRPLMKLSATGITSAAVSGEPAMTVEFTTETEGFEHLTLKLYKSGEGYIAEFNGVSDQTVSREDFDELAKALSDM